jgi:hypothetical protein
MSGAIQTCVWLNRELVGCAASAFRYNENACVYQVGTPCSDIEHLLIANCAHRAVQFGPASASRALAEPRRVDPERFSPDTKCRPKFAYASAPGRDRASASIRIECTSSVQRSRSAIACTRAATHGRALVSHHASSRFGMPMDGTSHSLIRETCSRFDSRKATACATAPWSN